jgi:DNA-binding PadR family transcriptional regulator
MVHVLIALADGEKHGYAIIQFVSRSSDGAVKLGAGTLYGILKRFLQQGWVAEQASTREDDDPRRRYYRLTEIGEGVLRREVRRLETLVRAASKQGLPAEGNA